MNRNKFERPPTAQEAVLEEVRRALLDGRLPPGSKINADAIANELNVSRAPVRDALRVLEGEGQVEYKAHRGYSVPPPDPDDICQIYRLRQLLESEAVLIAAQNLDDSAIEEMTEAADRVVADVKSGNRVATNFSNRDFHFALFERCRQPRLVAMIRRLWNSDGYRNRYFNDRETIEHSAKEHYEMIEAAKARDGRLLVELSDRHRNRSLLTVFKTLEDEGALPKGKYSDSGLWRPLLVDGND